MVTNVFEMVREVGRVPSSEVPLNAAEETRFERIMDQAVMIDVHQHPFLLPEDMDRFIEFLRTSRYQYGYQAVEAGGLVGGDHRQRVQRIQKHDRHVLHGIRGHRRRGRRDAGRRGDPGQHRACGQRR